MYSSEYEEDVPETITTAHKVGIWGGGAVAIIALIVAIVALVLVFVYQNENWTRWGFVAVSGTTVADPKNRTMYQIASGTSTVTINITTVNSQKGNVFGVGNSTTTGVGVLNVTTTAGIIPIYPASARQFIVADSGVAPFDYVHPVVL